MNTSTITVGQWIDALRSGQYEQGQKWLTTIIDGREKYCCLGVACVVAEVPFTLRGNGRWYGVGDALNTAGLQYLVPDSFWDPVGHQAAIWNWNDNEGLTFNQIADKLEEAYGRDTEMVFTWEDQ